MSNVPWRQSIQLSNRGNLDSFLLLVCLVQWLLLPFVQLLTLSLFLSQLEVMLEDSLTLPSNGKLYSKVLNWVQRSLWENGDQLERLMEEVSIRGPISQANLLSSCPASSSLPLPLPLSCVCVFLTWKSHSGAWTRIWHAKVMLQCQDCLFPSDLLRFLQ